MDWTQDAMDHLRALWAAGHSTNEIGRRMGITKSQVVGKAHRMELPTRPSPIRARIPGQPAQRTGGKRQPLPAGACAPRPVVALPPAPPAPVAAAPLARLGGACRFPIGEPGTPGFRFCGKPAVAPRKPYCAACSARAYARPLVPGEAMAPRGWVA